jgi:MMP 1-O-methyltransferase
MRRRLDGLADVGSRTTYRFISWLRWRRLPLAMRMVAGAEGMVSLDEAERLYQIASGVKSGCIVEVGSYRGRSTVALAYGSRAGARVPVYAVEPHEVFKGVLGGAFGPADRAAFFRTMLRTGSYDVVRLVNLSSEVVCQGWLDPVGFLFLDGDHTYEGVSRDFRSWSSHLTPDATIAFDDSDRPELGPAQLVEELLRLPEFEELPAVGKIRVLKRRA